VDVFVIDLGLYCRLSLAGGVVTTWGEVPLIDLGLCCRLSLAGGVKTDPRGKSMPDDARWRRVGKLSKVVVRPAA
jgi:hypothetical protein